MKSTSRLLRCAVLAAVLSATACRTQAALEMFLKLYPDDGTKLLVGESPDSTYPGSDGWFTLKDFDFGIESVVSFGVVGKATANVVNLSKAVDSTSPGIFKVLTTGTRFKSARLVIRKAGAVKTGYLQYEFNTVLVSSQRWTGTSGDDSPQETVSLVVGQALLSYQRERPAGTYDKAATAAWNFITNTSVFDPLPDGP